MYVPVCSALLLSTLINAQFLDFLNILQQNDNNVKNDFKKVYDFIIIGAGSGGSVVANRLTENSSWNVLLLEAGREESFLTDVPLTSAMQSLTAYNWGYKNEPSTRACLGLNERKCKLPRGKALGGTSVINFLLYTRGNRLDFDDWARQGNKGWSYDDVLPYFIKSENCTLCTMINRKYHGYNGYLNVQAPPYETPLVKYFLKAGRELGYEITDPNGNRHLGFSKAFATMRNGRRCSAAKAFLNPIKGRPNLQVVTGARVIKILIDPTANEAYGVEFLKNKTKYVVEAKKEVILSAGSINSPQLLMLSGIGPKDDLAKFGIPVIKELNVGHNLQDHVALNALVFLVNQSITVSDHELQNPVDVFNYIVNGKGPFTMPAGAEALAFLKTKYSANFTDDYPDIEIVLGAGALNGDSHGTMKYVLGIPDNFYESVYGPIKDKPAFSMSVVLMRPKSRGRVLLKDANPLHWPVIKTNYFQHEDDIDAMVEGIKKTIEVSKTRSFQKLNTTLYDFPFPGCEHVSFGSDTYWRCVLVHMATTLGHQVGTCKMGPKEDKNSVVDDHLRVYGIKKLRVVDGSIMPNLIAGHTNSVIMMIGEKASDLIKNDWR